MKKNIVKLIIGLFATGTVATTSVVITTKVVENKENKMAETKSNNTVIQNISEEINNKIENKVEEENNTDNIVEEKKIETYSENVFQQNETVTSDNKQIVDNSELILGSQEWWEEHERKTAPYIEAGNRLREETDRKLEESKRKEEEKQQIQTPQPTPESSTESTPEADSTEVVE